MSGGIVFNNGPWRINGKICVLGSKNMARKLICIGGFDCSQCPNRLRKVVVGYCRVSEGDYTSLASVEAVGNINLVTTKRVRTIEVRDGLIFEGKTLL